MTLPTTNLIKTPELILRNLINLKLISQGQLKVSSQPPTRITTLRRQSQDLIPNSKTPDQDTLIKSLMIPDRGTSTSPDPTGMKESRKSRGMIESLLTLWAEMLAQESL